MLHKLDVNLQPTKSILLKLLHVLIYFVVKHLDYNTVITAPYKHALYSKKYFGFQTVFYSGVRQWTELN